MQQKKRAWRTEDQELLVRTHLLLTSMLALIEPAGHANDNHDSAHLSVVVAETMEAICRLMHVGES
jgi:hypothetical protein